MKNAFSSSLKAIIAVIISLSALSLSASAQEAKTTSRVAVVANEIKTKIWVSDFPKNTTVVVMDSENNMLTLTTTNQFGAAYIALPAGTSAKVTVKTLDGGVVASNFTKAQHEESVASTDEDDSTIA